MSYTAQELNTKIGLERFESFRDSDGILHEEWVPYGEAFAKIEPLVGREYMAAAQLQAENNIKVTLRYRNDMQPSDHVIIHGEPWNVLSIQNIKFRNRELLLYCKRLGEGP